MSIPTHAYFHQVVNTAQYFVWKSKTCCVCQQVRYPPLPHKWTLCLTLHPLHHIQSAQDIIAGAMRGLSIGSMLQHSILATELLTEYSQPSGQKCVGVCLSIHSNAEHNCSSCAVAATCASSQGQSAEHHGGCVQGTDVHQPVQRLSAAGCANYADTSGMGTASSTSTVWSECVCSAPWIGRSGMVAECRGLANCSSSTTRNRMGCCHALGVHQALARGAQRVSPAAAAAMQTCSRLAPEVQWVVVHVYLENHVASESLQQHDVTACLHSSAAACGRAEGRPEMQDQCMCVQQNLHEVLLDDEWVALEGASVVLLDVQEQQMPGLKLQCLQQGLSELGLTKAGCLNSLQDPVMLVSSGDDAQPSSGDTMQSTLKGNQHVH